MAKILETHEFKSFGSGSGSTHPWNEWLDGQIRQLDASDFPATTAKYIAQQARMRAKKRGLGVHVSVNIKENTVILQAFPLTAEPEDTAGETTPTPEEMTPTEEMTSTPEETGRRHRRHRG